ncbi:hypothetical protein MML48_3g00020585 [Holotrichia oblita]|uniref:Uncharacterized protein n=1 Tax=Holotrichia oblita TaxID=644536 RepID=A0ACB9THC4_HOLOL|nr:hypothetical protein MML48_3g00020585 [Holotrichia oblita]
MDTTTNNGDVSEPQTPGGLSDTDFDDNLGVPDSLTVLDIQGSQIVLNTEEDDGPTPRRIPFNALYQKPVKFKSFHRRYLYFWSSIEVTIVDYENESCYTSDQSELVYDIVTAWRFLLGRLRSDISIYRTLHHQLVMFRTSLNIPFPTKEHKRKRESFRNNA